MLFDRKALLSALALSLAVAVASGQFARLKPAGANLSVSQNMEGIRAPVWSADSLVVELGMGTAPTSLLVFDRSGQLLQNLPFGVPGANRTFIHNFARGTDGSLAVCGLSDAGGEGAPFIALVSPDGSESKVIRTDPYTPNLITIAADGSIWTVGYELNGKRDEDGGVDLNAGVVRHFDRSGKTLHTFIPRSTLSSTILTSPTNGSLVPSGNGAGWFSFHNRDGGYAEISASGELTRYPLPVLPKPGAELQGRGLAVTPGGDVYVSVHEMAARAQSGIYRLDRKASQWQPVALPDPSVRWVQLYGASGTDLVLRMGEDSPSTFRFMRPAN